MNNKFILIDDDDLIHQVWKLAAEDDGVELHTYDSVKSFLSEEEVDESAVICLDSNLKNETGEIEAEKIYNKGFKQIYLVTAKHETEILSNKYITEIKGKKPLWRTL